MQGEFLVVFFFTIFLQVDGNHPKSADYKVGSPVRNSVIVGIAILKVFDIKLLHYLRED